MKQCEDEKQFGESLVVARQQALELDEYRLELFSNQVTMEYYLIPIAFSILICKKQKILIPAHRGVG